ncbi:MAG: hypothetical protein FWE51_04150 [Coriobacteriia bacterium]|nr:hypothetical protein [Coriobacteriia bacterium]
MNVFIDYDMSINELAKVSNRDHEAIRAFIYREEDPLPTLLYGKQHKIRWSVFAEWSYRNFGPDGPHRGTNPGVELKAKTK